DYHQIEGTDLLKSSFNKYFDDRITLHILGAEYYKESQIDLIYSLKQQTSVPLREKYYRYYNNRLDELIYRFCRKELPNQRLFRPESDSEEENQDSILNITGYEEEIETEQIQYEQILPDDSDPEDDENSEVTEGTNNQPNYSSEEEHQEFLDFESPPENLNLNIPDPLETMATTIIEQNLYGKEYDTLQVENEWENEAGPSQTTKPPTKSSTTKRYNFGGKTNNEDQEKTASPKSTNLLDGLKALARKANKDEGKEDPDDDSDKNKPTKLPFPGFGKGKGKTTGGVGSSSIAYIQKEHRIPSRVEPKQESRRTNDDIQCHYCGKKGHMMRICRTRLFDQQKQRSNPNPQYTRLMNRYPQNQSMYLNPRMPLRQGFPSQNYSRNNSTYTPRQDRERFQGNRSFGSQTYTNQPQNQRMNRNNITRNTQRTYLANNQLIEQNESEEEIDSEEEDSEDEPIMVSVTTSVKDPYKPEISYLPESPSHYTIPQLRNKNNTRETSTSTRGYQRKTNDRQKPKRHP
ncbi:8628_t:CDS:2, partial [Ambispora gerdemannii]